MAGAIPAGRDAYREWLRNAKEQAPIRGPIIGVAPAKVTGFVATCEAQLQKMQATDDKDNEYKTAAQDEKDGRVLTDQALGEELGDWKRLSGWTDADAVALRTNSPGKPVVDPLTHKVKFTVRIVAGEIRIDWTKGGVYGVHVYTRLKGQTKWVRIALDTSSPYIDGRELTQAGVPETREYMLRACDIDENDIGVDSDIIAITFGG